MADFRNRLITLAGIATIFSGMAFGQAVCSNATANAVFARAEGINEQVADVTLNCSVPVGNVAVANTQKISITVYMSPSAAITSANVITGGSAISEAIAGVLATPTTYATTAGATSGATPQAFGQVSGSTVTFTGITLPAMAAGCAAPCAQILITNIKINASTVATSSGVPTAVTETLFVSGTGVTPAVLTSSPVAFVTNGLSKISASSSLGALAASPGSPTNLPICAAVTAFGSGTGGVVFAVNFAEAYPNAFKTQGSAATNVALGSWNTATVHTETGYGEPVGYTANNASGTPVASTVANTATSGTRIQIVFNNVPAGYTIYVPVSYGPGAAVTTPATTNGAVLTLTNSATGALSPVTATTNNGDPGPGSGGSAPPAPGIAAPLTVANGTATAVYEVTTISTAPATFTIPVYLRASANALATPAGAITATVSFAPVGASSNVPNFVSGSSTATVNGSAFTACNTVLLFPFVTNQLGFDTGLAISNTSTDALTATGGSVAAKQSGTCVLNFFGASAPAAVTSPTVATGTTYAAAASTLAPGFQGYMIANCNFLYAHGFAYVVYNLTQNNGAAMGYLAGTINLNRASAVTATVGVGSNSPESSGQ